jgi:hypothetical protein
MGYPESNWDEPPRSLVNKTATRGAIIRLEYHGKVGYAMDGWFVTLVEGEWPDDGELLCLCDRMSAESFGGNVEPIEGVRSDGIGGRKRVTVNTD